MKKIMSLMLAITVCFCLCSCGDNKKPETATEEESTTMPVETTEPGASETTGRTVIEADMISFLWDFGCCVYVRQDVEAFLIGEPSDDAGSGDTLRVSLPAGTVLFPYAMNKPKYDDGWRSNPEAAFMTFSGQCVYFESETNGDGVVLFAGMLPKELFGDGSEFFEPVESKDPSGRPEGDVYKLTLWERLYMADLYKYGAVVEVDWDGDGFVDKICQDSYILNAAITYIDGKTGKETDLRLAFPNLDLINSDSLLCENSRGEYGILTTTDPDDSTPTTVAVTYDPENIIQLTGIGEAFEYTDGKFITHPYSECLGNQHLLLQEVNFSDDFTFIDYSDTKWFSYGVSRFVSTIASVTFETVDGSSADLITLDPGMAVIPEKIVTEADGTEYLYVHFGDGNRGRILLDQGLTGLGEVLMNGVNQYELFAPLNVGG